MQGTAIPSAPTLEKLNHFYIHLGYKDPATGIFRMETRMRYQRRTVYIKLHDSLLKQSFQMAMDRGVMIITSLIKRWCL